MSRPIKFRAWGRDYDTDETIMTKPFDFTEYVTYNEGAQHRLLPLVGDDVIFMQYTGLKDKNGVEIYEGDLLGLDGELLYRVEWSKHMAMFNLKKPDGESSTDDLHTLEVIGNIFENPELVEDSDES